jgi:hypothetical protein
MTTLTNLSLEELTERVYTIIKTAHDAVKLRDNPKTFLNFRDCVLIHNSYKFLKNNQDTSVLAECKSVDVASRILEQALNICHSRGSFSIEDAVYVNDLVAVFLQKTQSTKVSSTSAETEEAPKLPPRICKKKPLQQQSKVRFGSNSKTALVNEDSDTNDDSDTDTDS